MFLQKREKSKAKTVGHVSVVCPCRVHVFGKILKYWTLHLACRTRIFAYPCPTRVRHATRRSKSVSVFTRVLLIRRWVWYYKLWHVIRHMWNCVSLWLKTKRSCVTYDWFLTLISVYTNPLSPVNDWRDLNWMNCIWRIIDWNICQDCYDAKNLDERYKQQWTRQRLMI